MILHFRKTALKKKFSQKHICFRCYKEMLQSNIFENKTKISETVSIILKDGCLFGIFFYLMYI